MLTEALTVGSGMVRWGTGDGMEVFEYLKSSVTLINSLREQRIQSFAVCQGMVEHHLYEKA